HCSSSPRATSPCPPSYDPSSRLPRSRLDCEPWRIPDPVRHSHLRGSLSSRRNYFRNRTISSTKLEAFLQIILCRKHLEILFYMQATHIASLQRDFMVYVMLDTSRARQLCRTLINPAYFRQVRPD